MKAVGWTSGGKPDLELHDEPVPTPGPYDVLIRIQAASLNFRDQAILDGAYGGATHPNGVPVSDRAGEVVAVGEKVIRAKIRDRVAATCYPHWIAGPPSRLSDEQSRDNSGRNAGRACRGARERCLSSARLHVLH